MKYQILFERDHVGAYNAHQKAPKDAEAILKGGGVYTYFYSEKRTLAPSSQNSILYGAVVGAISDVAQRFAFIIRI